MREKADHYTIRAKKEGYPARSVYKLEEIDKKYGLIKPGMVILDVGAAPGSWSLYAGRRLKTRGVVYSLDLNPLALQKLPPRLQFVQGDFHSEQTQSFIHSHCPYDLVLSDAAPLTTGNRTVDTGRSLALAEAVFEAALTLLKPQGSLVIKIFQGGDEPLLLDKFKKCFHTAKAFKPKASRKDSFEIFFIGLGKK